MIQLLRPYFYHISVDLSNLIYVLKFQGKNKALKKQDSMATQEADDVPTPKKNSKKIPEKKEADDEDSQVKQLQEFCPDKDEEEIRKVLRKHGMDKAVDILSA